MQPQPSHVQRIGDKEWLPQSEFERLVELARWCEEIALSILKGKIDLKEFAALLAPLCRMLRDDVTDALQDQNSPPIQLAKDWRQLLFPDASDEQFADAYAQSVIFALSFVYFWRWALWKVFEHNTTSAPGIVSFITSAAYIEGDAFYGMREHMRRLCDEIR
ncbi:MAG: hypothetical protein HYZ81_16680 [Nitrospinae bacterium]|nr:hypothetical protein [Nitrospinota bacterium]